jgi:serine/threonine protein kinase
MLSSFNTATARAQQKRKLIDGDNRRGDTKKVCLTANQRMFEADALAGADQSPRTTLVQPWDDTNTEIFKEQLTSGETGQCSSGTESLNFDAPDTISQDHWFYGKVLNSLLLLSLPEQNPTGVPHPLTCYSPVRPLDTAYVQAEKQKAHVAFNDPDQRIKDYFHNNLVARASERMIRKGAVLEHYHGALPQHIKAQWEASARVRHIKNELRIKSWQWEREHARAEIMSTFGVTRQNLIGCGGFGRVYAFKYTLKMSQRLNIKVDSKREPKLDSDMVVKIGASAENAPEKAWYRRFQQEETPCSYLVQFFDIEIPDDRHFTTICLERASGGSLSSLIHDGLPMAERQLWQLLHNVSAALSYLHEGWLPSRPNGCAGWSPIIHKDLKSANILCKQAMDCGYTFVITDFGLTTFEPTTSNSPGTPEYLHPEYPMEITAAFDVWALGCVLHEAITLQLPRYNVTALNSHNIHPNNLRYHLSGRELCQAIAKQPVRPVLVHLRPENWESNEQFVAFCSPDYCSTSKALSKTMHEILSGIQTRPSALGLHLLVHQTIKYCDEITAKAGTSSQDDAFKVALEGIDCDDVLQQYIATAATQFEFEMNGGWQGLCYP